MRLFAALELPADAQAALAAWAAALPGDELRAVAAADLHVTLCFLGAQPPEAGAPIARALEAAVTGMPAVALALGAPVWLPRRRPRVLALGLDQAAPNPPRALAGLQERVAASLVAGGWYAPERRPFLAHVTAARVRGGGSRGPGSAGPGLPAERWRPEPPAPPEMRFRATEVALIRSRLGRGPARYERLHTVALR